MLCRILLVLLSSLSLIGCKTTDVYHFVHEETEFDRKSLQWSRPNPELNSELAASELPYLVVDFHSFWPGYSTTAYLYVVQRGNEPIELELVEVKSTETGEVYTSSLKMEASPSILEGGLRLFRYRILDTGSSDRFSEASRLQVTLKWVDRNKTARSTEFKLEKKEKSEIAWPT